jgi:hypothetical protein
MSRNSHRFAMLLAVGGFESPSWKKPKPVRPYPRQPPQPALRQPIPPADRRQVDEMLRQGRETVRQHRRSKSDVPIVFVDDRDP